MGAINISGSDFVRVRVGMCDNKYYYLMVDSGASISIFNAERIDQNQRVNVKEKCLITGVTHGEILSLGTTETSLTFDDVIVTHTFQVVDRNFPLRVDGIIGRDFLLRYKANIDYANYYLQFSYLEQLITVPLIDRIDDSILIPARSQVVRRLDLVTTEPTVIMSQQIDDDIFVANSMVDGVAFVRIVNTSMDDKFIKLFKPKTIPLRNYIVCDTIRDLNENVIATLGGTNDETGLIYDVRLSKLRREIDLEKIPVYGRDVMWKTCEQYGDVFALEDDELSTNNFYRQHIPLSDYNPVYTKNYRIPQTHREEIERQVKDMLRNDLIEHSYSPYNSPLLLVPKKGTGDVKRWRVVVDFRNINKKVISDTFPLPRIDEILDELGRARFFSILDLRSGFHQIDIEDESRPITAFSTNSGHYQFKRLPFGLKISPNSFQRMMSIAMSGLTPQSCFLYVDDLIVFGCSLEHHNANLIKVFEALRKFNLKLNPSKCQFLQTTVTYLGHQISDKGILPDSSKYSAVKNYPVPKNADDARRFVSFCSYYRRFIPNFAKIAYPLNRLTKKSVAFEWTQVCQEAFTELKERLMQPPILQFPDFTREFRLTTDASDVACGAVLSQIVNGEDLPVCYASRSFKQTEKHKHPMLKECIAIHWAVDHFKPYLIGRKFKVITDSRPLVYLFNMKNPTSKLTRMRLDLESFDFVIEYVKGKNNVCADALSRITLDISDLKQMHVNAVITRSMTKKEAARVQQNDQLKNLVEPKVYSPINRQEASEYPSIDFKIILDPKITHDTVNLKRKRNVIFVKINLMDASHLIDELKNVFVEIENYLIEEKVSHLKIERSSQIFEYMNLEMFKQIIDRSLKRIKIVILPVRTKLNDENVIQELIKNYHESPIGGHVGVTRLNRKLSENYVIRQLRQKVKTYVRGCKLCQINKYKRNEKELMTITDTPTTSFDIIEMDIVGPLMPSHDGHRYILTIQDVLTKYVVLVPVRTKSAESVARAFIDNFLLTFGAVSKIKTDMGTEFMNSLFEEVMKILQIHHAHSTPYHPQTIGALERNHRNLNEFLRNYTDEALDDWIDYVKYYEFCYNTTPCVATGYTPFELVYGKKVKFPMDLTMNGVDPVYDVDNYANELKYKLQLSHERANKYLEKIKLKRKNINDCKITNYSEIKIGDLVLMTRSHNTNKLQPLRSGPYAVERIETPNIVIRINDKETKTVHRTLLTKVKN